MKKEEREIVERFNGYVIADECRKKGIDQSSLSDMEIHNMLSTCRSYISPGAIYRWPTSKGDKTHVTGFGLLEMPNGGGLWFLASYNSKKRGKPVIEKLSPLEVLRLLEDGTIEYLGNIFEKEFRSKFDYERLSLAIMGFAALVFTRKLERNVSVDEIIEKIENGEMTMDELLQKCQSSQTPDLMAGM